MTTDKRDCCPACRSLDVVLRPRKRYMACEQCGWTGPRAALEEREPRQEPSRRAGLAGVLEAMDADVVGGDGRE